MRFSDKIQKTTKEFLKCKQLLRNSLSYEQLQKLNIDLFTSQCQLQESITKLPQYLQYHYHIQKSKVLKETSKILRDCNELRREIQMKLLNKNQALFQYWIETPSPKLQKKFSLVNAPGFNLINQEQQSRQRFGNEFNQNNQLEYTFRPQNLSNIIQERSIMREQSSQSRIELLDRIIYNISFHRYN